MRGSKNEVGIGCLILILLAFGLTVLVGQAWVVIHFIHKFW